MPSLHHSHPEAEERLAAPLCWQPKHAAKFAEMPPVWREKIARAKEMQIALQQSDSQFSGAIMPGSSWNQLFNGGYPVPSTERGLVKITQQLDTLITKGKEGLEKAAQGRRTIVPLSDRFVMRPEFTEVCEYLEDAESNNEEELEERIVLLIGRTRCGKSATLAKLKAQGKVAWHLNATPDLKGSYRAFLTGIAKSLRLRDLDEKSASSLQESIISKLGKAHGTLAIEELSNFSRRGLEFLKMLLNQTQVNLLICLFPGQYERLVRRSKRGDEDAEQFLGRSVGVVKLEVTKALVADFAPKLWQRCPQADELQNTIALEASKGGGMSLVRDVLRDAGLIAESVGGLRPHHVTTAIQDYRRKVPAMERRAA
jgi:hypothetical protein